MKPGPNYKMSRATKTMLARNWNNPNLSSIRRSAIQGELLSTLSVKHKNDSNK